MKKPRPVRTYKGPTLAELDALVALRLASPLPDWWERDSEHMRRMERKDGRDAPARILKTLYLSRSYR